MHFREYFDEPLAVWFCPMMLKLTENSFTTLLVVTTGGDNEQ